MNDLNKERISKLAIAGSGAALLIATFVMHAWWVNVLGIAAIAGHCKSRNH